MSHAVSTNTEAFSIITEAPATLPGGDAWFERLVEEYQGLAFAVAMRVTGDAGMAEDVVQEAFISVWRHAEAFDQGRGTARAWLLTVVRNRAIDRVRAERSRPASRAVQIEEMAGLPAASDVWAEVCASLDGCEVRAALLGLPQVQRKTIEMAYFAGLTHVEIAQRMDVPLGTVKGRMRLGLEKLRTALTG